MSRLHPSVFPLVTVLLWLPAATFAQTNTNQGRTGANANNNQNRATGGGGANGNANANANNGNASSTRQYRNNTQLGDALIQIDPESRSLVIVADEDTHGEIMRVIKNLDRPKPQVLIKVLFAQVTLDDSTDIGVEGSYAFNVGQPAGTQLLTSAVQAVTGGTTGTTGTTTTTSPTTTTQTTVTTPLATGGNRTTVTTNNNVPFGAATSGLAGPSSNFGLANQTTGGFFRLSTQNATATLYALAQKGKVSILSRPSILARNNQQAVIVVGQEVPIPTSNQVTDTGNTIQNVSYQDVGIILRVTPFITINKTVEMIVSPEISSLSNQTVQVSSNFAAPVINKTSAETVVVTPDRTTVVIGGLMQKQESSQVNKVPLLGDIPYLGNLFKRTTKTSEKTELVIFLTPYIVEGTDRLEALSVDDVNRTDLPQQAFTPKDVSQYLDDNFSLFPQATPPAATTTATTKKTTTTRARKATPVAK